MAEDQIRYDILAQDALRGVVRKVLAEVARTGLPGEHHFFISFVTRAPGVRMSERLLSQYDKEMTIVLQNQFWDLKVTDVAFEVGLSFDGQGEMLHIPFAAIKGFFDPSVQFGLQFDVADVDSDAEQPEDEDDEAISDNEDGETAELPAPSGSGDKVVSLDQFRKKP
ncbi:MAG TPA: SspB family protein [Devosiaceae bacterium]